MVMRKILLTVCALLTACAVYQLVRPSRTEMVRRAAFARADNQIAREMEMNTRPILDRMEREGINDDNLNLFKKTMIYYSSKAGELQRQYDAGLMPDASVLQQ